MIDEKLMQACKDGNADTIKEALQASTPDSREVYGLTMGFSNFLYESVLSGNVDAVKAIWTHADTKDEYDLFEDLHLAIGVASEKQIYPVLEYMLSALKQYDDTEYTFPNAEFALGEACEKGDWKAINMIVDAFPGLDISNPTLSPLSKAVLGEHWEVAKFLLTSDKFAKNADVHVRNNTAFCYAIRTQNEDMAQYFLYSKELKENANPDLCLFSAMENGYKDVVEYLLYSPDVTTRPNLHFGDNLIFKKLAKVQNLEMMQYLVDNIDCTPAIDKMLNRPGSFGISKDFADKVATMFDRKDSYSYKPVRRYAM